MIRKINFLALIIIILMQFVITAQQLKNDIEQAFYATRVLRGKSQPRNLNWINNGMRYSYSQKDSVSGHEQIWEFNPETLQKKFVLDAENLKFPGTEKAFNYKSFQWGKDSKHLLFESNFRKIFRYSGISDFYIYSLKNKSLKPAVKNARTAELSPDGSKIGYERNGNLYVYNFVTLKDKQLTDDSSNDIFNGHGDWVYEEEFGKAKAWDWSPDSKYISYWQFNEKNVPVVKLTDFEGLHPKYEKIPIPQVGDPNPQVKIGILDISSGKNIWLIPADTGDYYIPRVYWTSKPGTLAMIVLNRSQNELKLYFFNVITGHRKLITEEKSNSWISIFNFYTGVSDFIFFPQNTMQFFWISDRDGWYKIYRYDYEGNLLNQVTKDDHDIVNIVGIDAIHEKLYYNSFEPSPLEENLFSIKFNGSAKKRLTSSQGYHSIDMSPNTKFYIDTYSNVNMPEQVELYSSAGKVIKKLEDNSGVTNFIKVYKYSHLELFSFYTSDSVKLDCSIIKPFNFDSTKKYPVVMDIYGGPESHSVFNTFETSGWKEYLSQNGYLVVDVNNRGNTGYGSAFEKIVYKQLGRWESNDFVETAKYLESLPYVDKNKMAIMGTSYGGYSAVYTMLTHPGIFKVAISNSPVTDWRLYDDIYTERYMGLISDNEQGYLKSDVMTYADSLLGKLLVIHSLMDDNVHVSNTMQLLTDLTNAGKDVDLRIYPPGAHGAFYNKSSLILIDEVYLNYLNRYLKGDCSKGKINSK